MNLTLEVKGGLTLDRIILIDVLSTVFTVPFTREGHDSGPCIDDQSLFAQSFKVTYVHIGVVVHHFSGVSIKI